MALRSFHAQVIAVVRQQIDKSRLVPIRLAEFHRERQAVRRAAG